MRRMSKYIYLFLISLTLLGLYKSYHFIRQGREYHLPLISNDAFLGVSHLRKNATLAQLCSRLGAWHYNTKKTSQRVHYLFERTGICYCSVPKAASTSLIRYILTKEYPEKANYYEKIAGSLIHVLPELPVSDPDACANGSKMSFFVSRNPYERLFSAYIDKIYLEKFHQNVLFMDLTKTLGTLDRHKMKMLKKHLEETDALDRCTTTNITFEQFLNVLISQRTLDHHFAPITTICNPCEHHFDVILKQESLHEHVHELTKYLPNEGEMGTDSIPLTNYSGTTGIRLTAHSYYNIRRVIDIKGECSQKDNWLVRQQSTNERLWNALKMLGNIDEGLKFNNSWFNYAPNERGATLADHLVQTLIKHGVQPLDEQQRDKQRNKYLRQAYTSISRTTLDRIQRIYQMDFILLGYDKEPPVQINNYHY
ncbi:Carbohydrate (N-acetylgalactosamine 4-0) sulfotransferase 8 [Mactra antiquata]